LNRRTEIFFIGSYTEMLAEDFGGKGEGIYTVEMNMMTGQVKVLSTYFLRNPAYFVRKEHFLYVVSELENPSEAKITAFYIKEDHQLEFANVQNVKGSLPCHVNILNDNVFVACYGSGNVLNFPLTEDGEILKSKYDFHHVGSSINADRQEAPHAHQIAIHPDGKHFFVPDLGIDKIKVYGFENEILKPIPELDIVITEGLGPRHMVFNSKGDMAYVMNELTGTVAVLKLHNAKFECISLNKALPETFTETPAGSAIRIHPNGKYLYTANRTIDILTVFQIEGDNLNLLNYQYTNGKTIREFHITTNGLWLIACLQDSNEVVSYHILENGLLEERNRTNTITSPVCVCF